MYCMHIWSYNEASNFNRGLFSYISWGFVFQLDKEELEEDEYTDDEPDFYEQAHMPQ